MSELLEIGASGSVPLGPELSAEAVADPHLDAPPTIDADWVARVGATDVVHVEFQGYRDGGFSGRLFHYHLGLLLRFPDRRVHTVAVWVIRPPSSSRLHEVAARDVRFGITSIVLSEVPAERLLQGRHTACFAAAADAGSMSETELCDAIVRALMERGASERQRAAALVLAVTRGRYDAMVEAMQRAGMEPVILEDFVRFGEDRGLEKARSELVRTLVSVLAGRGLEPSADELGRIEASTSIEQLGKWCARAATSRSVAEVLED